MKTKITVLIVVASFMAACAPNGKSIPPGAEANQDSGLPSAEQPTPVPPPLSVQEPIVARVGTPAPLPTPYNADKPGKFSSPWSHPQTTIVIDAYQGNSIDWDKMASDNRVGAVVHRSSIGTREDTQYKARRQIAKAKGYLWGAYHLGSSGDPVAQAMFYLQTVGNDPETLLMLDLEDTSSSSMMNAAGAASFVSYIYNHTGRIPVIYANHSVTKSLNQALSGNALIRASKLWYARYKSTVSDFPKGIWQTYFLWQFSSELNCTHTGSCAYNVPGTQYDMDINVYDGTREELAAEWK